ncbi:MAG TPA: methyltransferase domain-containing protein [Candidatus Angelobacter sp.]|nr:methyltransferase domain-containing protein [Candidatus Angelobacter sp.]
MSALGLAVEKADLLRAKVNVAYSAAASSPEQRHPFPIGRKLAEGLGYPVEMLDSLPKFSVDAFAGVSNVSLFADLTEGAIVLDLGCGAGMDSIVAARRVGPAGRVIGVDFSKAMLARARAAKEQAHLPHLDFLYGDAEHLPLPGETVDVALVNGIFNLNPKRRQILSELVRVLRPGGRAYVAELVLTSPLAESDSTDESNWFA